MTSSSARNGHTPCRFDLQSLAQQFGYDLADRPALLLREHLGRSENGRSMSMVATVRMIHPFPSVNRTQGRF